MYINHINKYDDAQAIQAALDAGTLANPYVAMTSAGTIDYNSFVPTPPPSAIGEWTIQPGHYAFQIIDADPTKWVFPVNIGSLVGVYFDGSQVNMEVDLSYESNSWRVDFTNQDVSDSPSENFYTGTENSWNCEQVLVSPDASNGFVNVLWDGVDTFMFSSMDPETELTMTTINPVGE